jgi:uncharacterized BrkB/YihY/UPF0761 family membrane protein
VRALAYQSAFVIMSGFVGVVGLASVLDLDWVRVTVRELVTRVAPGEAGRLLQEAAQQGASGGSTAAVVGLGAALVSGTLAMAQLERSALRLNGLADDGPALGRYARALALAVTAGLVLALGGLVIGGGRSIAAGAGWEGTAATVWDVLRWPLGLAVAGLAIAVIVRVATPGRLPMREVAIGAAAALVLWAAFTAALGLYLSIGSESQSAYGPMLSVIAVLLWAAATSLALHLGLALVAERRADAAPLSAVADAERPAERLPAAPIPTGAATP